MELGPNESANACKLYKYFENNVVMYANCKYYLPPSKLGS